jgi:glycosyltransferase involved in cell wall biosynthesis
MRPLLTAALIVRDEAEFLDDCLSSVRAIVDEIVVVDTGSQDASLAIASAHGAAIRHHPWNNDFSAARNVALDAASGAWILYIDADERLESVDPGPARARLASTEAVAFRVRLRPSPTATPYREYRLWRNDPRIRFEGVIHEKVVPAIHRVAEADGRPVLPCDLELVHYGYEGDQTRKHRRNLPMLQRQREIEPDNLFVWHHLARVQEGLGEPAEAEATLEGGLRVARAKTWCDPVGVLLYTDLVRIRAERDDDDGGLLAEALIRYPDNLILLWYLSRAAIRRGDYEAAMSPLHAILAVNPTLLPDLGPSYDQRFVQELPHDALGLCLFRLGRYEDAAQCYQAAAMSAPGNPAYRAKVALARAKAAQHRLTRQ